MGNEKPGEDWCVALRRTCNVQPELQLYSMMQPKAPTITYYLQHITENFSKFAVRSFETYKLITYNSIGAVLVLTASVAVGVSMQCVVPLAL